MHIIVEQSQLAKALSHVSRIVERRNTGEVLSNVLLDAFAGGLRLKATDLDITVTETIGAMTNSTGQTTVSAQMLFEIVKKLSDAAQIELKLDEEKKFLLVESGDSHFKVACLSAESFPVTEAREFTHKFSLVAGDLYKLLSHSEFAISTEETRYYLTGAYFHCVEEEGKLLLRTVSTDGHRLAKLQMEAPIGAEGMPSVILGRKLVVELVRLLAEDKERDVQIELSVSNAMIRIADICIVSSLIEGNFPDYTRVIPKNNDKYLRLSCSALKAGVERVSVVANERGRAVKFSLVEGRLTLSVNSAQTGSAEEKIDVSYENDPLEIGFNARYLLDVIAQIPTEDVLLNFLNAESPALIHPADSSDDAMYVLMPMRC